MAKKVILAKGVGYMGGIRTPYIHFARDLAKLYGYDKLPEEPFDFFDDSRLSLESVMTAYAVRHEVFEKPLGIKEKKVSVGTSSISSLEMLKHLMIDTITEALRGPICKKHIKLAESMKDGDIILNFNYDILIENALRSIGKFADNGYMVDFHSVFDGRDWFNPEEDASAVRIIKLHGSLNWIRCRFCRSNHLLRHQKVSEWVTSWPYQGCPKCKTSDWQSHYEPLLVPPIITKSYSDPDISYLWLEAERMLSDIEEVIMIGYSMPRADFASETLLRVGLGTKARRIPTTIVNPDKEVKSRLSRIFDSEKIVQLETLNEYLESAL